MGSPAKVFGIEDETVSIAFDLAAAWRLEKALNPPRDKDGKPITGNKDVNTVEFW